jgi:hypothetical protein
MRLFALLALLCLGCDNNDADATPAKTPCEKICDAEAAAECAGFDEPRCLEVCKAGMSIERCSAEIESYADCYASIPRAKWSCDGSEPAVDETECDEAGRAMVDCAAGDEVSPACSAYCASEAAAECDTPSCQSNCQLALARSEGCRKEMEAYLGCLGELSAGEFTCDGPGIETATGACGEEGDAAAACLERVRN